MDISLLIGNTVLFSRSGQGVHQRWRLLMRASVSMEKLWGMDFNTGHQQVSL